MDWHPLNVDSHCIYDDAVLREHIQHTLTLGLPVVSQHERHEFVAVFVASGPSVETQIDSIRRQRAKGRPIVAINEAHDWLLKQDIVPEYAAAMDPRDDVLKWFANKQDKTTYLIASQCHPKTFEHLRGNKVYVWNLFVSEAKSVYPTDAYLIGGGATTGLRVINLFYTMGFCRFELYGYDSCLKDGVLRVNGDLPKATDKVIPVKVGKRTFFCTPAMAHQAQWFQKTFDIMPDILVQAYGDGLIKAILDERIKQETRKPKMRPDAVTVHA